MDVILLQNVENLGKAGDVVKVKDGYVRNFLLPRKLAIHSTGGGLRFLEARKKQAVLHSEQLKRDATTLGEKIEKVQCVIKARVGEEGKLFGSITTKDVHDFLEKKEIEVDRKKIEMAPIHALGEFQAVIKLHPEVHATLAVTVVASAV